MGLYAFIAKLFLFIIVIAISFVAVEMISVSAGLVTAAVFGLQTFDQTPFLLLSNETLSLVGLVFIGTLFTVPLVLSLVGFSLGGAWVRHVASRSAKHLGLALLLVFGLDVIATMAAMGTSFPGVDGGVPLIESLVVGAMIGLFLLAVFSRTLFLRVMGGATDKLIWFFQLTALLSQRRVGTMHPVVAAVELQVMPMRHIREKEKPVRVRSEAVRFQRLLQALSTLDARIEFRLSFREGRGQVLISAARNRLTSHELQERLLAIVRAHLPEFRAELLDEQQPPQVLGRGLHSCSLGIQGVPAAAENPLEPLSRYFLENDYEGDYTVVLERARTNSFAKRLARSEQREIAKRSGKQQTKQATIQATQTSTSIRDYLEEVKLQQSMKMLERYHSDVAMNCWVRVSAHAGTGDAARRITEGAASVIIGALSEHRSISALKVRRLAGGNAPMLVDGGTKRLETRGRPTLLLPAEGLPYIWIPHMAIGTAIVPSAEFELPPRLEGEIELGTVVTRSSSAPTRHKACIPIDVLTKHAFYTGMTGSGKTTSCFNLLLQLYQLGVPFLVIEPVKSEYRSLIERVPSLRVFTLGDEWTAPFRLNIFEPPRSVKVQTHLENLQTAWNASFVMYAPLPYVVTEVLTETYAACGWSVKDDIRGRPITLKDFGEQATKVARRLGYDGDATKNIEAALRTRITSLMLGGKGCLFDAVASIPVEEILRRPTVIELKGIQSDEEKAFVTALLLMSIVEHIETRGSSRQLRHLILIEEAHRLLPNLSTHKGDPEAADPRKRTVEQFANMLAEIRAYGEGLAIVEQIPTKIIPDAIKNTATKVAHRVPAADDREVLAGAMNMTKEQMEVLGSLQPGEAVVNLERNPLPIRILAPNVTGPAFGEVGDARVREHMAPYYAANPLPPRASRRAIDSKLEQVVDSPSFKTAFLEAYRELIASHSPARLFDLLVKAARDLANDEESLSDTTYRVLVVAVERLLPFDEVDRLKFPAVMMKWWKDAKKDGSRAG